MPHRTNQLTIQIISEQHFQHPKTYLMTWTTHCLLHFSSCQIPLTYLHLNTCCRQPPEKQGTGDANPLPPISCPSVLVSGASETPLSLHFKVLPRSLILTLPLFPDSIDVHPLQKASIITHTSTPPPRRPPGVSQTFISTIAFPRSSTGDAD